MDTPTAPKTSSLIEEGIEAYGSTAEFARQCHVARGSVVKAHYLEARDLHPKIVDHLSDLLEKSRDEVMDAYSKELDAQGIPERKYNRVRYGTPWDNIRWEYNIPTGEIAEKSGSSRYLVTECMNGIRQMPHEGIAKVLAKESGLSLKEVMDCYVHDPLRAMAAPAQERKKCRLGEVLDGHQAKIARRINRSAIMVSKFVNGHARSIPDAFWMHASALTRVSIARLKEAYRLDERDRKNSGLPK